MALIFVENLHFAYNGQPVLQGINLKIEPGVVVSILGPNGSGKTTLLRCLYRMLRPKVGCIYLDGKNLVTFSNNEIAKIVGGIPQEHSPMFPYRVIDLVVMGKTPSLDLFSAPSISDYEVAKGILENLGISCLAEKPYTQLSGGEKQLVLIARALMQNPKILLLDEPTKHLDVKNKVKVLSIVKELATEKKLTIIMTLHDPNEAIMFSDKILLINGGKIIDSVFPEMVTEEKLGKTYGIPFKILKEGKIKAVLPVL